MPPPPPPPTQQHPLGLQPPDSNTAHQHAASKRWLAVTSTAANARHWVSAWRCAVASANRGAQWVACVASAAWVAALPFCLSTPPSSLLHTPTRRGAGLCQGARGGAPLCLRTRPCAAGSLCHLVGGQCHAVHSARCKNQQAFERWCAVLMRWAPRAASASNSKAYQGRQPILLPGAGCQVPLRLPPVSLPHALRPQVPRLPPRLPSHHPAAAALRLAGPARGGCVHGWQCRGRARVCAPACEWAGGGYMLGQQHAILGHSCPCPGLLTHAHDYAPRLTATLCDLSLPAPC